MTNRVDFAVLGAGRQGTAAAYDLARSGRASRVLIADADPTVAVRAADRVNGLTGSEVAVGTKLDVREVGAVETLLVDVDVAVCAVPFRLILGCTKAALRARTSMVDLGGHTETVLEQLELDEDARAAGVAVVPDCGMGPGLNNTLGVYAIEQLEARGAQPRSVRIWDGGLPRRPPEPWGYQCSFNIDGLINEYDGHAVFLRHGEVTLVETLTELETVHFDATGDLEAFVTSGGTSTVPYTYERRLETYENKTLRYPGHCAQFKAFKDLGLFSREPIEIAGLGRVSPRAVLGALLRPQIEVDQVEDICLMRARGEGFVSGADVAIDVEIIDGYDETTGLTGMERLTGFHAAIMAEFVASGAVEPGVRPVERAIEATPFLRAVKERGISVAERWET
jgi:lysine 6-dehydrogenase